MTNNETIKLGYEKPTGEQIDIPVKHSVFSGITRHGKSEAMKTLATRVEELGYTVLLFDVKPQRPDFNEVGTEIPVYLEQAADPRTLRRLLEGVGDKSMSYQFAELVKLYEEGDDYQAILDRIETWLDEGRHPIVEDKLIEIQYLLEELVSDLDRVTISSSLKLAPGINVMDLTQVEDSVQQLAVSSTVKRVLDHEERVIVGVDEASRFIPQGGKPPASKPLVRLIREGAAKEIWLWISDQTITGTEKEALKQVDVWLFGRQREKNEIERVRDQVGRSAYSFDDVKTMETGHFIVDLEDQNHHVYVQPVWMNDEEAKEIATGNTPLPSENSSEDTETMEDELAQKESRIKELEQQLADRDEQLAEQQEQITKLERLLEESEEPESDQQPTSQMGITEDRVLELINEYASGGMDDEEIRSVIDDYISEYEAPESVAIDTATSKLIVRRVVEPIEVSTDDTLGKVAYLYTQGELPGDSWFTTGDVEEILTKHGWSDTVKRTSILNDLTQMGFLEMKVRSDRTRAYRVVMQPDEAMDQGLLEVEELVQ